MKTAEEVLKEKFEGNFLDIEYIDLIVDAMEEYAEQQVKLLATPDVSEHLCQYESDNTTAMNCKHCGEPKRSTKHYVMPRLFVITAQEGWNEMFWDKEKAQHKIDTQYKKDFPNDEFWIEEVNVS